LSLDAPPQLAQETAMRGRILIGIAWLLSLSGTAAAADEQPICADRPSKSTGACTVPVGRRQLETGLVDWTHDRSGGLGTDFTALGSSLLKYGVSGRMDVELGVTPVEILRGSGRATGFGDVLVRAKYHLTPEGAPIEAALDPFVKIPTANHRLGNGRVEGGLVVPTDAQLGKTGLTLSLDPELDVLADGDGHGRHFAMVQVVNLGASLTDKLSVSGEIWGMWNWDPAGTVRQASADGAIAYDLSRDVQLDAGANFGLNRQTPDVELYTGVSVRF
jgi:hypothetical protein